VRFKSIKKILFIRSDRLGEFLLSLPAIKLVKNNYPEAQVYLLAKKDNIELVRNIDFVDYFLEYKDSSFSGYLGGFKLARLLTKECIDCVVMLNPRKDFHLAAYLARVPFRVGYDRKWGWCLTKKIEDKKALVQKHEAEYNIDLVSLICDKVSIPQVELPVDRERQKEALQKFVKPGEKFVVIHPFTSNFFKGVEPVFWVELAKRLQAKGESKLLIIGTADEQKQALALERKLNAKNLVGKLPISTTAALLKDHCSCFVGLDSGPMHLASLLGVPVVGLFKVSNPKRWGPSGKPSLVIKEPTQDGFIRRIDDIVSFVVSQSDKTDKK